MRESRRDNARSRRCWEERDEEGGSGSVMS